ncbi:MAG TPA: ABC transporter substrate-binding protein [Solirubrobacteraceae bacterium]|nr:ABC transporter substrate-binding protein [Solirubrobacteraceae bacterium]
MLAAAVLSLALTVSACGSVTTSVGTAGRLRGGVARAQSNATLILDFTPNAVHAGVYRALAAGYYRAAGIDLKVVSPTSTQETLKLIDAGRAQFGLADGSDVAGLIDAGGDAKAVMAIVSRPVGGLIALRSERLRSPAGLAGRTVGVTGVPSDLAVLDTELRAAGVDPARVRVADVGFDGAAALLAGRIAAFTGFIPDDGVALSVGGHPIEAFALDRFGGPPYPGLVAFTTARLAHSDPALVHSFVAATLHGYRDTLADPGRSLDELLSANPSLPRALSAASLRAYLPLFSRSGAVTATSVRAMSSWMLGAHLIHAPIAPQSYGISPL